MPVLEDGDVHIWRIPLGVTPGDVAGLWPLLSAEERSQAGKIISEHHRVRFTACRAAVRQILGTYLAKPPEQICVEGDGCRKLHLGNSCGKSPLRFNVSQSRDLAVLGVAHGRELGVDIEAVRPVVQLERIADRVLGPGEKEAFFACEPSRQVEMFFRCWTQKKAYVKALAAPRRIPLDLVEVEFRAGMPVQLRVNAAVESARDQITVCDFIPQTGFCGAFAVQGKQLPRVQCWNWCQPV